MMLHHIEEDMNNNLNKIRNIITTYFCLKLLIITLLKKIEKLLENPFAIQNPASIIELSFMSKGNT